MDKANQGAPAARNTPQARAPRNPNCNCSFCAEDWWVPHPMSVRAVHAFSCIEQPDMAAPRRGSDGLYCCCNHCFRTRATQRESEKNAAAQLADALEALLADHDALWKCSTCPRSDDARAALRLAGREANNVSAAPAAPSNSKEQP